METVARNTFLQTLLIVLAVHVAAFVIYHLHAGLLFNIRFVHLRLEHEWLGTIVATMYFLALYAPIGVFAWMALTKRYNIPLLLLVTVVTMYCSDRRLYPVITAFLVEIGQFETQGEFIMSNIPGLDQYPEFQSMEMSME
jgi:nicotinamide riboside transporter PnuC